MMKKILLVLLVLPLMATAQSLEHAVSLFNQKKWHEAALELRPLADSGNAQAQYLSAILFIEGLGGVNKDANQAIKYATMSAEQGCEGGALVLAKYYQEYAQEPQKAYNILEYYRNKFPHLITTELGSGIAKFLMEGIGVEKDEERAWQIVKKTSAYEKFQRVYKEQYAAYLERHPEENVKTFEIVEQMPSYPGGQAAMMQFLQNNIRMPNTSNRGKVFVQFVIGADGTVCEAKVVKSIDPLLDREAVRVISMMPQWTPGRQNGEAVRVRYTLPITFR